MPYQLQELLLSLFNLTVPLWGIWAGMMFGGMVNRYAGIAIALFWSMVLAGSLWYQFVGSEGSGRYLVSRLDQPGGNPGYDPVPAPWWLPSENILLTILIILVIFLTPIVTYIREGRKIDDSTPWSRELSSVAAPIARILLKASVGYLLAVGAILTGAFGAVLGMVAGFLFGIPAGFILGIITQMDYESAVFVFVYPGGALGFIAAGGFFVISSAAGTTRRAINQMNEIHNARLEDKRRLERDRADAEKQIHEAEAADTAQSKRRELRMKRAMEELQGD